MAATTKILQLRPKPLPIVAIHTPTPASVHFFCSSIPDSNSIPTPEPPPQPKSQSQSQYSSYFRDIKASLKQSQQQRNPQSQQPPRKSFSFGSSFPPSNNAAAAGEVICRNLSEFRRRTVPPPPTPSYNAFRSTPAPPNSSQPISLEKLYERNVASKIEGPTPDKQKSHISSFQAIRESLSHFKPTKNGNDKNVRLNEPMSPSYIRKSLKLVQTDQYTKPSPTVIGSGDSLPASVFGPEIRAQEDGDGSAREMGWEFVKMYDHEELGEKLRLLRPEKKGDKKDWFSLEELNQRLVKLREMEERESESRAVLGGVPFRDLRKSLQKLTKDEVEDARKNSSKF